MMPFDAHSAHSGCDALNALLSLVHRAVWYRSAERSLTYFPSCLDLTLLLSHASLGIPYRVNVNCLAVQAHGTYLLPAVDYITQPTALTTSCP